MSALKYGVIFSTDEYFSLLCGIMRLFSFSKATIHGIYFFVPNLSLGRISEMRNAGHKSGRFMSNLSDGNVNSDKRVW